MKTGTKGTVSSCGFPHIHHRLIRMREDRITLFLRSSKDSSLAPISHDDGGKAGETGENYVAYEWHTRLSRNTRERTIATRRSYRQSSYTSIERTRATRN